MSLFARMKISAFAEPTLQAFFGSDFSTFRWFDTQLPQGKIPSGTCARLLSVSQITTYLHNGRNKMTQDRVQIDVLDPDPEVTDSAAEAISTWLDKANFVDNGAFMSPVRTGGGPPANFRLNQRGGVFPLTDRAIPVTTLDYRIFNVEPS
jgi:hypothetical protein